MHVIAGKAVAFKIAPVRAVQRASAAHARGAAIVAEEMLAGAASTC